jgi:hypothetical protein
MSSSPPPPGPDELRALLRLVEDLDADNERLRQRVLETMEWTEASVTDRVRAERELDAWRRQAQNLVAEIDAIHASGSWRLTAPVRALNRRLRRRGPTDTAMPAVAAGPDGAVPESTPGSTPVFIPVRDRVTSLRTLIDWLETAGHEEIWLVDNASTYRPLLDYLDSTTHRVVRLDRNLGHRSPFLSGVVQREAAGRYFVITDPDVVPDEHCPPDAVAHFREILDRYPEIDKVGFGLRIDDLPPDHPLAADVVAWESRFWADEVEPGVYRADIDTTFALYRPLDRRHREDRALRTGAPYLARHLPWYVSPADVTDEDRWYRDHAEPSTANWDRDDLPRWKRRWLDANALGDDSNPG